MNSFIKTLVERDGLSTTVAANEFEYIQNLLLTGELDMFDLEDYLMFEYSLEPDYVMGFF